MIASSKFQRLFLLQEVRVRRIGIIATAIIAALISAPTSSARSTRPRQLTFEDRVHAQEAIERVYYFHQIGATKTFEEAVPREVLEKKVRTYLKQSLALEAFWETPVTADALESELDRIARGSRLSERLQETFEALANDSFVIQECLARPTLVDRLTRSFFSSDRRYQGAALEEAEGLRNQLLLGELHTDEPHPRRMEVQVRESADELRGAEAGSSDEVVLAPEAFRRWRSRLPAGKGDIGAVTEETDSFVIGTVLEDERMRVRAAQYRIPKQTWDVWWLGVEAAFDPESVVPVAMDLAYLPAMNAGGIDAAPRGAPALRDATAKSMPAITTCVSDEAWDSGSHYIPDGRVGHSAVWTGSLMIVWGGYANTGGRYDPLIDSWTPTSTLDAPAPRYNQTAVWTGSLMIVWGGSPDSGPHGTGGRYDPVADTWTPTSPVDAPIPRYNHSAVWTGSLMIVWGGFMNSSPFDSGGRYDPMTDTWAPTSTLDAPAGRYQHTSVWTDTRMVVWGGYGSGDHLNTGGRYDPATDSWAPTSTLYAPSARSYHTAVWTGSQMIIWGGYANSYPFDSGGRYDPAADTWKPVSLQNAPSGRVTHTAVWTGSRMLVWGGDYAAATGGRYNPVTDKWTPTSTQNAPDARTNHTAVWTGSRMIVWGGYDTHELPDTGGRYDPETDSWTPTFTNNEPSAHFFPSVIWTGSQMIVWGGGISNIGGRYDPMLDAWRQTSTLNAPMPRYRHAAVWTGSRMIVWGGAGYNGFADYHDTGGRYDPVADTWTPTSTLHVPLRRSSPAVIWTGSLMIVWGGSTRLSPNDQLMSLDTGGRYDPRTDTWIWTSTLNAPSSRHWPTAIWTGSLMVVWGGITSFGPGDTGGRYDPLTDTWTSTSTLNSPSPRYGHTAVWTGSQMVIWGGIGWNPLTYLDTGGRYDPTVDSWTSTSTLDAPSGRADHLAVWTGSRMIVWGGRDNANVPFATGGRYEPATDAWTPTTMQNAPPGRYLAAAIWTGDMMIIWGGSGEQTPQRGGGRYDPGGIAGDDEDEDGVCSTSDNCDSRYNPGQANSDGDTEGGDACDITVTFPLAGDLTCADPPPMITWSPETYDRFRVMVSWLATFPAEKTVTSGDTLLRTTSWTVPARKWSKLCSQADRALYFKVLGKTAANGAKEYSEVAAIAVK